MRDERAPHSQETAAMNSSTDLSSNKDYANIHVSSLLLLPEKKHGLQEGQGSELTSEALLCDGTKVSLQSPILIRDPPDSLGMKIPPNLTIRDVADHVGYTTPVRVMDVRHQEELDGWTLSDLVEYFEERRQEQPTTSSQQSQQVLNQISLEFSQTRLADRVASPDFVRDLDWIDNCWSSTWRTKGIFPAVQYYCLTSAAGSYTDFHIDFGGTSVWYHVVSGSKVFVLIPPSERNLEIYNDWMNRQDQSLVFLPDLMIDDQESIIKVRLEESQTLVIPSGWIHAVYTPDDALVLGGNFLHGLDMKMQLLVNSIEEETKVRGQFRFPYFKELHFFAAAKYLKKMKDGEVMHEREVRGLKHLIAAVEEWWIRLSQTDESSSTTTEPNPLDSAREAASSCGFSTVEAFLDELRQTHARLEREGVSPRQAAKVRLKIAVSQNAKDTNKAPFRIQLSPEAVKTTVLPRELRRPSSTKEDTEWIDEEAVLKDDEWTPSGRRRSSSSSRRPSSSGSGSSAKKAKTTSARQRLLKRVR